LERRALDRVDALCHPGDGYSEISLSATLVEVVFTPPVLDFVVDVYLSGPSHKKQLGQVPSRLGHGSSEPVA
jgi:hypothetical protein